MSSKSNSVIQTTTNNDESQIQALNAIRGDNNTTSVLDGDAIKASYAYAAKVGDNTSNNIGQVLNTIDSVAGKAIAGNADTSSKTIKALQDGMSQVSGSVQAAYAKSANGGVDPQMVLLGIGALVAVAFIFKG